MSKFLLLICAVQLIHFIHHLIRIRVKDGVILDLWAFQLIISNVLFYFLMYPFAKAIENEGATGEAQFYINQQVDEAFKITSIGYLFMWLGKYLYDFFWKRQPVQRKYKLWYLAKTLKRVINAQNSLWLLFLLFLPSFLFVAVEALKSGNLLGARASLSESSSERPLYNVAMSIYPVFISILGVLYLTYGTTKYLMGFLLMLGFSFILGSRGAAFGALSTVMFIYTVLKGSKIGWLKVGLMGLVLIVGVVGFGLLRSGAKGVNSTEVLSSFLYGNTFSDLRDFAWFLSVWDGKLILGKTYLSGLLSFIPSGMWEFRSIWSVGKVTTNAAGLTGAFHGGLRITFFGESYINFGIIGMVVFSFTFGYLLEAVNRKVMYYLKQGAVIDGFSMMLMTAILSSMMITASFFVVYVIFIPIVFFSLILSKKKKRSDRYVGSPRFS